MTEEEAKTKWCPQMNSSYTKCIASDCMMWKWDGEITRCVDDSYASYRESETEGHCGLAK